MRAFKVKDVFYLDKFPQSVKNGTLEYCVQGQGYKKTKKFEVIESSDFLERGDKEVTWLYVAKMFDKYGIEVAEEYADCLTAGIVARQFAYGYGTIYQKIKHLLPIDWNDVKFFELLRCDYMMACFGMYSLDIIGLDAELSNMDSEYNATEATYKGVKVSMKEYVTQKYGKLYADIIEAANK